MEEEEEEEKPAGPEARHEWAGGADGPAAPSLAASRAAASGRPSGRAVRLPCAQHLRTAPCVTVSAGDSLEGGHSLQPLHTSLLRRASQNGGAHGAGGGRSPAPFCARREICQRGNTSAEDAADWKACGREPSPRGPRYTRCGRRTPPPPPAPRPRRLLEGEASEAAGVMAAEGRGGPRPAAPGTPGGVTADRGSGGIEVSSGVRLPGPSCVPGSAEARAPGVPSRGGGPGDPGDHGGDRGDEGRSLAFKSSERRPGTVC